MKTVNIKIQGMSCSSCVGRVEKTLSKIPSVKEAKVSLATNSAIVHYDEKLGAPQDLVNAVETIGYDASLEKDQPSSDEDEEPLGRNLHLLLSILLTVPLVLPMILMVFGIHWELSASWQLALATPVQFWIGAHFYRGAFHALKNKLATMDVLVVLGTSAAYFLSLYHFISKQHEFYFESSATIITLVMFGKWLEEKAKHRTTKAIRSLHHLRPAKARLIQNEQEREVELKDINVDDHILVKAGERIPMDGMIVSGAAFVDEALLTGESIAQMKNPGDAVIGGSFNSNGYLTIQVTKKLEQSYLNQMMLMIEDAALYKAPIQRFVDKIAGVFVPVVIFLSLLTFLGLVFSTHDTGLALLRAVAVLVIACPCALGLATPTAFIVGTGKAAEKGILIRHPEVMEKAKKLDVIVFDKTGTLTTGKPSVVTIQHQELSEDQFLTLLLSLEKKSEHPLAAALVRYTQTKELKTEFVSDFEVLTGAGVQGKISGRKYLLTSLKYLKLKGLDYNFFQTTIDQALNKGESLSFLVDQEVSKVLGLVSFADTLKPEAKDLIQNLKARGIESVLLSGDNQKAAQYVGNQLGIAQVFGEQSPESKLAFIQKLQSEGKIVGMVGDGINDALSLQAADLSFAMSSGTDVTVYLSSFILMRSNLGLVIEALDISMLIHRKVKQNLFWAGIYNILGIPLAAFGWLNPMLAGACMGLSSVSVMLNALSIKRSKI